MFSPQPENMKLMDQKSKAAPFAAVVPPRFASLSSNSNAQLDAVKPTARKSLLQNAELLPLTLPKPHIVLSSAAFPPHDESVSTPYRGLMQHNVGTPSATPISLSRCSGRKSHKSTPYTPLFRLNSPRSCASRNTNMVMCGVSPSAQSKSSCGIVRVTSGFSLPQKNQPSLAPSSPASFRAPQHAPPSSRPRILTPLHIVPPRRSIHTPRPTHTATRNTEEVPKTHHVRVTHPNNRARMDMQTQRTPILRKPSLSGIATPIPFVHPNKPTHPSSSFAPTSAATPSALPMQQAHSPATPHAQAGSHSPGTVQFCPGGPVLVTAHGVATPAPAGIIFSSPALPAQNMPQRLPPQPLPSTPCVAQAHRPVFSPPPHHPSPAMPTYRSQQSSHQAPLQSPRHLDKIPNPDFATSLPSAIPPEQEDKQMRQEKRAKKKQHRKRHKEKVKRAVTNDVPVSASLTTAEHVSHSHEQPPRATPHGRKHECLLGQDGETTTHSHKTPLCSESTAHAHGRHTNTVAPLDIPELTSVHKAAHDKREPQGARKRSVGGDSVATVPLLGSPDAARVSQSMNDMDYSWEPYHAAECAYSTTHGDMLHTSTTPRLKKPPCGARTPSPRVCGSTLRAQSTPPQRMYKEPPQTALPHWQTNLYSCEKRLGAIPDAGCYENKITR